MKLDTDKVRAEIEALPEGPERDAAMSHLIAVIQHAEAVQTWITTAHQRVEREAEAAGA